MNPSWEDPDSPNALQPNALQPNARQPNARDSTDDPVLGEEPYVPIGERINQDVWHDNFVPKYSALATAPSTPLVLTGVWVLFGPMALMGLMMIVAEVANRSDWPSSVAATILPAVMASVAIAILFVQTKRYVHRDQDLAEKDAEDVIDEDVSEPADQDDLTSSA